MTTIDLSCGPACLRALARSVVVPFMAACRIGAGSEKVMETGEAR
jgi:hypothetical protein